MEHCCYILYDIYKPNAATYNGYTNNPSRRLRQHNSEIAGGARFTTSRSKKQTTKWDFLVIVCSEELTKNSALSLEWHIKYPNNKRPRPIEYQGAQGRLKGLSRVLSNPKFDAIKIYNVFVNLDYYDFAQEILQVHGDRVCLRTLDMLDTQSKHII